MRDLTTAIIHVLRPFERVFSERVWEWAKILLVGAILAPGKRTVTAALRVMGLSNERQFQNYHRVLNRATWSCNRQVNSRPRDKRKSATSPALHCCSPFLLALQTLLKAVARAFQHQDVRPVREAVQ